jgi:hypothetical protein
LFEAVSEPPKDLAHLGSLPKRFFGVCSMRQRILVASRRATPFAAMHATEGEATSVYLDDRSYQ